MTEKKKRKRKSMTAIIRDLREDNESLQEGCSENWKRWQSCLDELKVLKALLPLKYYKVDFKIKNNDGHEITHFQIVEAYSAELAIKVVKRNKTFPESFKLINITMMAQ